MVETHNSIIDMRIQDIPRVERPREKLIQYGSGRLSNSELLALLLRSGKKGENVISLANKVLKKYKAENLPTSGDPEPSEDDLELNKRLVEAGKILGIEVIDHIIVTRERYLSFKEKGLL